MFNISILGDNFLINKCSEKVTCLFIYIVYTYISEVDAHIIVNLKFTYYIISAMEAHIIVNQKFTNRWQDRLSYPGSIMMHKLFEKNGYILKSRRFFNLVTIVCC